MTNVAILPIPTSQGHLSYCAVAGERHAQGETAGEALDALTALLSADEASTLIIVQNQRPDQFFTAVQQQRLDRLMARWRSARDHRGRACHLASKLNLKRSSKRSCRRLQLGLQLSPTRRNVDSQL
jgi:hypothetical protein